MNDVPLKANLKPLFLMEVFSGLSRGSYLICIGWTTLIVTDEVSRVGQVFIIAMLTGLFGGPFIGTIVDRYNRKYLVVLAHLGISLVMSLLALTWVSAHQPHIVWLFCAVIAASALRMLHNSAHDALIQAAVPGTEIVHTVARFRTVHLISTAVGTVMAGIVIERVSPEAGFLFSAAASLLLVFPMVFVVADRGRMIAPGVAAFMVDLRGGLEIFKASPEIRLLTILAAVSLPVGQLANAILSSLIRDDLGMGSEVFGIVDAAWPLGGMLAAMLLSFRIRCLSARNMEYVFALLAGVSTVGLSLSSTVPMLVIWHGAMGISVWLCRIVIDSRVLEISSQENVGRTKVGVEMAFSLFAVAMCLSPTLIALPKTAAYFQLWGGVIILGAGLSWMLSRVSSSRSGVSR